MTGRMPASPAQECVASGPHHVSYVDLHLRSLGIVRCARDPRLGVAEIRRSLKNEVQVDPVVEAGQKRQSTVAVDVLLYSALGRVAVMAPIDSCSVGGNVDRRDA